MSKYYILVLFFFLVLLATQIKHETNIVYLTKNGFVPAGIKVNVGQTVKFISANGHSFWPASDPHPEHTAYSQFDSKTSVKAGNAFEFTFDEQGTYRYHNHLNPNERGVIKVVSPDSQEVECKDLQNIYQKEECFLDELTNIQLTKGDEYALAKADEILKSNKDLTEQCHDMAHVLGEHAYWNYSKTKKLTKSDKVSFCGFGFVHGFVQEFAHHSPKFLTDGKKICGYFSEKIKYKDQDWEIAPKDTCYNGIGHGIVFLLFDNYQTNLVDLVDASSKECNKINTDSSALDHCYQGVFSGISGLYLGTHGYKIPVDSKDPFYLCRQLNDDFNSRCFANMIPAVGVLLDRDISRVLGSIVANNQKDYEYALNIVGDIASEWYRLKQVKAKDVFDSCRSLSHKNNLICIKGFIDGAARIKLSQDDLDNIMSLVNTINVSDRNLICKDDVAKYICKS